jgi:hypothetical protein
MADAYVLSLEVDDNGTVKVQNFKKTVEDAGAGAEKAGKKAKEAGDGGFRILGLAVAKGTEGIGLNFKASHMLGNKVEELAKKSFPAWGLALGVAGGAALAVGSAVFMLIEHKKKLREELDKNIASMQGEVDQLYKNTHQSREYTKAQYEGLQVEREQLQLKLAARYEDDYEKLKKLNKEAKDGPGIFRILGEHMKASFSFSGDNSIEALRNKIQQLKNDSSLASQKLAADLEMTYQQILKYNKKPTLDTFQGYGNEQRLSQEVSYTTAVKTLWEQQGVGYQDLQKKELEIFNLTTQQKLSGMDSGAQKQDYLATREVELAGFVAKQKNDIAKKQFDFESQLQDQRLAMMQQSAAQTETINNSFSSFNQYLPGVIGAMTSTLSEQNEQQTKAFDAQTLKQKATFQAIDEKDAYVKGRMGDRNAMLDQQQRAAANRTINNYSAIASFGMDMYTALAKGGSKSAKEQFEAQKKANLGHAIVSTASGIARAFADYQYPLSLAIAALVGIAGIAQVSAINSTSYDGGGTPAAVSTASSSLSGEDTAKPQYNMGGPVTNIYVTGDVLDMDQFSRKIYPSIKKAERDGTH